MKKPTTTMYSWARMRAIPAVFSTGLLVFLGGCAQPWQGKFVAPQGDNCHVLDFVEVHGDQTADIKYEALEEVGNFPALFLKEDSMLLIRQINREWAFKWDGGDTLYEISNQDPFCFLVREK